jgi:hypothetical protein
MISLFKRKIEAAHIKGVLRHDVSETDSAVSGISKIGDVLFAAFRSHRYFVIHHPVRHVFRKGGSRNRPVVQANASASELYGERRLRTNTGCHGSNVER